VASTDRTSALQDFCRHTGSAGILVLKAYNRNGAGLHISGRLTAGPSRSANTIQELFDLVLEVRAHV